MRTAVLLMLATAVTGCATLPAPVGTAAGGSDREEVLKATLAHLRKSQVGCVQPSIEGATLSGSLSEDELFPFDQRGNRSRAELRREFLEQHSAWFRIDETGEVVEQLPKSEGTLLAEAALHAAERRHPRRLRKIEYKWLPQGMSLDHQDCGMMIYSPVHARGIWFVDTFLNRGSFGGTGFMFALRRGAHGWALVASRRSGSVIA